MQHYFLVIYPYLKKISTFLLDEIQMVRKKSLFGKRVHIAGSISPNTSSIIANYAHEIVRNIVRSILMAGGGIVIGAGKEPKLDDNGPALIFDWTVLEIIEECIQNATFPKQYGIECPIIIILSKKGEEEIPEWRKFLWNKLLNSGYVDVKCIMQGSRSATMIRNEQIKHGDILFILGGGTGVEHLAAEYMKSYKPVIPLDLPLGASREDGTGGSERLAGESRVNPKNFIRLKKDKAGKEGAFLAKISTEGGRSNIDALVKGILEIIMNIASPTVFYTRLLDPKNKAYERVEKFFRNVVDPFIEKLGLNRIDLNIDSIESGFINTEIFKKIRSSKFAIVDITSERPNCFIELGYALGHHIKVICTAEKGTTLPFDQAAIPCYFWVDEEPDKTKIKDFRKFWYKYVDREPI